MSELFSRLTAMSLYGLLTVVAILLAVIWVARPALKNAKSGDRIRIKAPFIEIETGPPASPPAPEDADGKIPEQRPPAVDGPQLTDSDPPG